MEDLCMKIDSHEAFAGLHLLAYHYINPGYPVDSYEKAKGIC
jgi:hypothetical protein